MVQSCRLEYLPNINQLIVYIEHKADGSTDLASTKIYFNPNTSLLYTSNEPNQQDDWFLLSLKGKLSIHEFLPIISCIQKPQCSIIDGILILQFRSVKLNVSEPQQLPNLPRAVNFQKCNEVRCASCGHMLLQNPNGSEENGILIWKDLPNEHWLELLDCWSCHDNEFAPVAERVLAKDNSSSYQQLNNSSSALILPSSGKVYCGLGYLIFNQTDFSYTHCPSCNNEIGGLVGQEHFRVSIDSIQIVDQNNFAQNPTFTAILIQKILDSMDNHSTFNFVLSNSRNQHLFLKALNFNTVIFDPKDSVWKLVVKVGTVIGEKNSFPSDSEVIACADAQFSNLLDSLELQHQSALFNSTIQIPGSFKFNLSYLF